MIKTTGKISFIQLFMVIMLFNGLLSHVIVNPILLEASRRDAWLAVLFATLLFLPWCALLVYIMNKSGRQKIQPWLAEKTSPLLSWLILAPIIAQLYLIGGMTIIQTTLWTVSNYLPATPQYVLILTLLLVSHFAARNGIRTIAIGSGILLPIVVCLGYYVSFANMPNKDWFLLLPMMEDGWGRVLNGMVYIGGAFIELSLVLLLQHRLSKKVKVWQMLLLGLVLAYITLGPVVGAITEFGPDESAKQMVSPYEQWRLVKLGSYIEHVDFFSVFQWIAGASVRISLAQFLLYDLIAFKKPKSRNRFLGIITLSYLVITLYISRKHTFYLDLFEKYLVITLIITLILSAILTVIALFSKSSKEVHK